MKKLIPLLLLQLILSGCFLDSLIGTNGDNRNQENPSVISFPEPNPPEVVK